MSMKYKKSGVQMVSSVNGLLCISTFTLSTKQTDSTKRTEPYVIKSIVAVQPLCFCRFDSL